MFITRPTDKRQQNPANKRPDIKATLGVLNNNERTQYRKNNLTHNRTTTLDITYYKTTLL
jgi:hypothetical protein